MTRTTLLAALAIASALTATAYAQPDLRLDPTELNRFVGPNETFTLQAVLTNELSSTADFLGDSVFATASATGGGGGYDVDTVDDFGSQLDGVVLAPGESLTIDYLTFSPISPPVRIGTVNSVSRFAISYQFNGQRESVELGGVLVTVVPEPSTMFLGGLATCGLLARRHRG